jgi:nicotinic acid mononucleotide adenylyltransferase
MSRKDTIANILKSCQHQEFFTTFTSQSHWPYISSEATKQKTCRLLVLDSSFNPPTKAHANLLSKALASKPSNYFDASLLLFSTTNADKKLVGASVLQRACMMELMAASSKIINIAVGFTPHAKFVDKAKAIESWFQNPVELVFILGYDTIIRLFDPKYYNSIPVKDALASFFENHKLVCADRKGSTGDDDQKFWNRIKNDYNPDLITRIQLDQDTAAISSTMARSLLSSSSDEGLDKVLDLSIIQFIREESNLYV